MHIPNALVLPMLLGMAASSYAAAPIAQGLKGESVLLGESVVLSANVADGDSDLERVCFFVNGPGLSGWAALGEIKVSGNNSSVDIPWTPPALGIYTARIETYDRDGNGPTASAQAWLDITFEVFSQRVVVKDLTINNGETRAFNSEGEIRTKENTAGNEVVLESGGIAVFWAKSKITLKPGFRAKAGSTLWATVDTDLDGYSDMEESTDHDRDGMPDAWEYDHGLDPFNAADASADRDGDGLSNKQEYQQGTNIDVKDNPAFRFVIFSPTN